MVAELQASLRETGQPAHEDPVLLAKVVLDSLALRYASVVHTIEALTGRSVPGIHVVGGGSRNDYLNQATADATGRPVLAGPVEAAVAGNLLLQAIAAGDVASVAEGRRVLARADAAAALRAARNRRLGRGPAGAPRGPLRPHVIRCTKRGTFVPERKRVTADTPREGGTYGAVTRSVNIVLTIGPEPLLFVTEMR